MAASKRTALSMPLDAQERRRAFDNDVDAIVVRSLLNMAPPVANDFNEPNTRTVAEELLRHATVRAVPNVARPAIEHARGSQNPQWFRMFGARR